VFLVRVTRIMFTSTLIPLKEIVNLFELDQMSSRMSTSNCEHLHNIVQLIGRGATIERSLDACRDHFALGDYLYRNGDDGELVITTCDGNVWMCVT
jgi:hypothetical protein